MPRARSPERQKAFELWIKSKGQSQLKDIAAELGVSPEQVRKWKCADAWDSKTVTVTLPNGKGHITKRKRGGQPGNKNADGGPPGNKKNLRHGAYERVMGSLLSEDEAEIFNDVDNTGAEIEAELRQTLAALNAKEVRLIKHINDITELSKKSKSGLIHYGGSKTVIQREAGAFEKDENGRWGDKVGSVVAGQDVAVGERQSSTSSHTISVYDALQKLEAELDRVQGRKIKVLGDLEKIHIERERLDLERKRLEGQTEQSKLAKAWIAALTGEEFEGEDDE